MLCPVRATRETEPPSVPCKKLNVTVCFRIFESVQEYPPYFLGLWPPVVPLSLPNFFVFSISPIEDYSISKSTVRRRYDTHRIRTGVYSYVCRGASRVMAAPAGGRRAGGDGASRPGAGKYGRYGTVGDSRASTEVRTRDSGFCTFCRPARSANCRIGAQISEQGVDYFNYFQMHYYNLKSRKVLATRIKVYRAR